MQKDSFIHVAVGVVLDGQGNVLIAKRHDHVHQGGKWEFPGGKVEEGETVTQALKRELMEEVSLALHSSYPLITIRHEYEDKTVFLDVHKVTSFSGQAAGAEGQDIRWANIQELDERAFPVANKAIIRALKLPAHYVITGIEPSIDAYLEKLEQVLARGERLIQLRAHHLSADEYLALAKALASRCDEAGATLLLNTDTAIFAKSGAKGLHLTAGRLMQLQERPSGCEWLSASVHTIDELRQAKQVDVDLVLVSPVNVTSSHPEAEPIGVDGLRLLAEQATMLVYALGGIDPDDLEKVREAGGQGVAGISAFWW